MSTTPTKTAVAGRFQSKTGEDCRTDVSFRIALMTASTSRPMYNLNRTRLPTFITSFQSYLCSRANLRCSPDCAANAIALIPSGPSANPHLVNPRRMDKQD